MWGGLSETNGIGCYKLLLDMVRFDGWMDLDQTGCPLEMDTSQVCWQCVWGLLDISRSTWG